MVMEYKNMSISIELGFSPECPDFWAHLQDLSANGWALPFFDIGAGDKPNSVLTGYPTPAERNEVCYLSTLSANWRRSNLAAPKSRLTPFRNPTPHVSDMYRIHVRNCPIDLGLRVQANCLARLGCKVTIKFH